MSIVILLQNVWKEHPPAPPLLTDCSLEVGAGEVIGLLGPSGAGKTTLLRLIAGLDSPSRGAILLNGQQLSAGPQPGRDVGMAFQTPVLFPHLNVEENLAIGWRLRYNSFVSGRWGQREQSVLRPRLDQMAELLELGPLLRRQPATLSGGERQRVALGRVLISRPAVFLLDEPLACLDPPLADRIVDRLRPLLVEWQATVLWVTHRREEARRVGSRGYYLSAGRLVEEPATNASSDR
jgi:ABC-type sugar transport system ATPase subunit